MMLRRAQRFYTRLFGWQATVMLDAGGYTMFHQDGKAVAAAGPDRTAGRRAEHLDRH